MSASLASLRRALRSETNIRVHSDFAKRPLAGFLVVVAIGVTVLFAARSFSRIGLEQERRQFEAIAAVLARDTKADRKTLEGLAVLMKAIASDCDVAMICNGSLKEKYLRARTKLEEEISNRMASEP